MTPLPVLFILLVLWAVVLVPPLLRSRSQRSADSIVDFNYKLDVLGRTNGHLEIENVSAGNVGAVNPTQWGPDPFLAPALRASAAQRSAQRRRDILRGLAVSVVGTLALAAVTHAAAMWGLQIFVDVLAATYLGLFAWSRTVQAERAEKVRYMPERRAPALVLRRSASS